MNYPLMTVEESREELANAPTPFCQFEDCLEEATLELSWRSGDVDDTRIPLCDKHLVAMLYEVSDVTHFVIDFLPIDNREAA